jgi:hypothetical protein
VDLENEGSITILIVEQERIVTMDITRNLKSKAHEVSVKI